MWILEGGWSERGGGGGREMFYQATEQMTDSMQ